MNLFLLSNLLAVYIFNKRAATRETIFRRTNAHFEGRNGAQM